MSSTVRINLKGADGANGTPGTTGATGSTGAAATVAVGSVTTLAAGSSATVTNVGTSAAAVLNFGIPQGDSGKAIPTVLTTTGSAGDYITFNIGSQTSYWYASSITHAVPTVNVNFRLEPPAVLAAYDGVSPVRFDYTVISTYASPSVVQFDSDIATRDGQLPWYPMDANETRTFTFWWTPTYRWATDDRVYLEPELTTFPTTTQSGATLYLTGKWQRDGLRQEGNSSTIANGILNDAATVMPVAHRQLATSAGWTYYIARAYRGADGMPQLIAGATGITDPSTHTVRAIPQPTTTNPVTIHESGHVLDFSWIKENPSVFPLGYYVTSDVNRIAAVPSFLSLYNACVADNSLNHGQYAFTNQYEFWAECYQAYYRYKAGLITRSLIDGIIGASRYATFQAILTELSLGA